MILPQTQIATPEWVKAQEITHWLTHEELEVSDVWASEKRRLEWRAGRLAVKRLLRDSFDLDPLEYTIEKRGVAPIVSRGLLPHISLSLSHSHSLGAASWSDRNTEGVVGIDAQHVRPVHPGLLNRVFTLEEQSQIRLYFGSEDDPQGQLLLWAIKEAAIKSRCIPWERALREISATLTDVNKAVAHCAGEPTISVQMEWMEGWWLARAVR